MYHQLIIQALPHFPLHLFTILPPRTHPVRLSQDQSSCLPLKHLLQPLVKEGLTLQRDDLRQYHHYSQQMNTDSCLLCRYHIHTCNRSYSKNQYVYYIYNIIYNINLSFITVSSCTSVPSLSHQLVTTHHQIVSVLIFQWMTSQS